MRDTGGELPERGELLCLNEAILRGAQVLQRFRQFARAGLNAFKQPHVLDRNRRLVRERRDQLDLFVGEWTHSDVSNAKDANREFPSRNIGTVRTVRKSPSLLRLDQSVFRISLHVGNVNDRPFKQRPPVSVPRFGMIGISLRYFMNSWSSRKLLRVGKRHPARG